MRATIMRVRVRVKTKGDAMEIEEIIGCAISHRTENFVTDEFGNLWQILEHVMHEIDDIERVNISEFPDYMFEELEQHRDSWRYANKDMS